MWFTTEAHSDHQYLQHKFFALKQGAVRPIWVQRSLVNIIIISRKRYWLNYSIVLFVTEDTKVERQIFVRKISKHGSFTLIPSLQGRLVCPVWAWLFLMDTIFSFHNDSVCLSSSTTEGNTTQRVGADHSSWPIKTIPQ